VLLDDDRHHTPFNAGPSAASDMPGVLIHAHALAQILKGRTATRSEPGAEILIAVVLILIGMALAFWGNPATIRIGFLTVATAALWVGRFALYQRDGPLIPLVKGAAYGITSAAVGARLRKDNGRSAAPSTTTSRPPSSGTSRPIPTASSLVSAARESN
jgi:CHASE2 domain-containing sensor protein